MKDEFDRSLRSLFDNEFWWSMVQATLPQLAGRNYTKLTGLLINPIFFQVRENITRVVESQFHG
jgi:hypothetical protein